MSEPTPTVHVFGLGPGGVDLITTGTLEALAELPRLTLRTRRHPAADALAGAASFDEVYDTAEHIESVYPEIVERLVADAIEHGSVGYVVPGSPVVAEHSVELLVADPRVRTVLHPALSFLDLTWVRLGIDPVETGVRLVDGHRFEQEAAGERGPMLVAQCDHRFVLSDIKLSVEDPPDQPVTLLHHLGLPDERIEVVDWSDMDRSIEVDHLSSLWIPRMAAPLGAELAQLEALMARLRAEDPWKAAQTHDSLQRYLVEESYEVLEAIDAYDPDTGEGAQELCSELGDLLYQVVFHSALAAEAGWFTLGDVVAAIHDKLVRRHPHVLDAAGSPSPGLDELVEAWERDKRTELGRASHYDGIPAELPALARAAKLHRKDDPTPDAPEGATDADRLGEQLWALTEVAHRNGIDPEQALRREVQRQLDRRRAAEVDLE